MALSFSKYKSWVARDRNNVRCGWVDVTLDAAYPPGGWAISASDLGLSVIYGLVPPASRSNRLISWDQVNGKLVAYNPTIAASLTAVLTDDNSAATNGTALKLIDNGDGTGYFESVNAGSADAVYAIGSGGPTVTVDYVATTTGDSVYFDEDATAGSRILHAGSGAGDVKVPLSTGGWLTVTYSATADSDGVALYFDDDAANSHERMLFVSPSDADGSETVSNSNEIPQAALSAEVIRCYYEGV